jgi:zinc/manganese transport system substrate-binding protein
MMKSSLTPRFFSKASLSVVLIVALVAGCSSANDSKNSGKIKIVAAENFYGEVAKAVGGDHVEVISLLDNPEADPHDYEPTPQASKDVDAAKIVVYNGIGYDEWMKKLIDASRDASNKTVVAVGNDLMGKKAGDNEHVWYDPETFPKYAKYLADQLGKLDTANAAIYTKQADAYIATLAPIDNLVKELKQASPLPIAGSEPVFDYMAQALNLTITDTKFEMAVGELVDPAPADVAQLQNDIKAKKLKLFINNIQNSSPTVKNIVDLATKNGIPVVEVTETLPKGKNYVQWMTDQLNQIKSALK